MFNVEAGEIRRRSIVKALIWRLIGIVWTWIGAYLILLFTPEKYSKASIVASLIVIYHHSTRMVMYYFYERIWSVVKWGKISNQKSKQQPLTRPAKLGWLIAVMLSLAVIFFLILYVLPKIKH
jgi:uncharacterized membrane protein